MANKKLIPTKINKEEMTDALKRSGYLIEQRIYPILESLDYYFETNSIYEDPEQHKAREIDFKARKLLKNNDVKFEYMLFGECINNPNPIIFFPNDVVADLIYRELSLTYFGLPKVYPNKNKTQSPSELNNDQIPLSALLKLRSFHHYFNKFPCTQYCSFQYKNNLQEWMTFHDDSHHEDFNKLIDSIIFEKNKVAKNRKIVPLENIVFYYPLIVLAGEMFECTQQINKTPKLKKTNHIKYKKSCIIDKIERHFMVDVIKESHLKNYLKMMYEEHSMILIELTKNIDIIKKQIEYERSQKIGISFSNESFY